MRLLTYREFAGGPFVGEEEQEICAIRGVRPERIHQLTCLLLAALSQPVAVSTSSTTSASSSLQPAQPGEVPFVVVLVMMLFNLEGRDLAAILFTNAMESVQTWVIETWRQLIAPGMFCCGMPFLLISSLVKNAAEDKLKRKKNKIGQKLNGKKETV